MNFKKSFFSKSLNKVSEIDSAELGYTTTGDSERSYAEKIALSSMSFSTMEKLYVVDPFVRAIVDRIVERNNNVSPLVKPVADFPDMDDTSNAKITDKTKKNMDMIEDILATPNSNGESLSSLRKKIDRDLSIFDAAGLEIIPTAKVGSNSDIKNSIELYAVPGNTIKINADRTGILRPVAYKQLLSDGKIASTWSKDELIYFMCNPQSNRLYGLSPLESLNQTITAELYADDYNLSFYYNNATPRLAVLVEGLGLGQGTPALQRLRTWWDTELRDKPHRPIILGTESGKIELKDVSRTNEDMQFIEYCHWLLSKIMTVYKMQPIIMGLLSGKLNQIDTKEQIKMFKQDAILPRLNLFSERFNSRIIFNVLKIKDVYLDFDLDLGDSKDMAEIYRIYAELGVLTINDIRVHGLGMTPVPWGNVPYLQNNKAPFGMGPNGQTLPGDPADANLPNVATDGKKYIKAYLNNENGFPIGWEGMEVNDKMNILYKTIKKMQGKYSKVFYNSNNGHRSGSIGRIVKTY